MEQQTEKGSTLQKADQGWRKGPWTAEEDRLLIKYINLQGEGQWNNIAKLAGLKRNGKSCRLRWVNYLRPDLKRGHITPHEETIIHELHARWGNRWSTIARSLPGRTDNEIKNYWRTHFKKIDKTSTESPEKLEARLLRRQLFQYHHQQQEQQYQQHLQDQVDTEKTMSFFDESDSFQSSTQFRQEMIFASENEDQGFIYSEVNEPEASFVDDHIVWDGLWNLDDLHGSISNNAMDFSTP